MFAKCLQTMLEARFPERGMTLLERRIANYVDPRSVCFWLSKLCILWRWKRTIPPRIKGCHWLSTSRTKEEMEAKYMAEEIAEPVEVDLPDPALSPTSKLIHNNKRMETDALSPLQQEIKRYESCVNPGRDITSTGRL